MYGLKHSNIGTHTHKSVPLRGIIRGVFRTQSNICDGAFLRKSLKAFIAPSHMVDWVLNIPLNIENRCSWNCKIS